MKTFRNLGVSCAVAIAAFIAIASLLGPDEIPESSIRSRPIARGHLARSLDRPTDDITFSANIEEMHLELAAVRRNPVWTESPVVLLRAAHLEQALGSSDRVDPSRVLDALQEIRSDRSAEGLLTRGLLSLGGFTVPEDRAAAIEAFREVLCLPTSSDGAQMLAVVLAARGGADSSFLTSANAIRTVASSLAADFGLMTPWEAGCPLSAQEALAWYWNATHGRLASIRDFQDRALREHRNLVAAMKASPIMRGFRGPSGELLLDGLPTAATLAEEWIGLGSVSVVTAPEHAVAFARRIVDHILSERTPGLFEDDRLPLLEPSREFSIGAARLLGRAASILGVAYAQGHGVPRDPMLAVYWLRLGIAHRTPADFRLATLLEAQELRLDAATLETVAQALRGLHQHLEADVWGGS